MNNTKLISGLALALVLGSTVALAGGNNNTGGDSCRGNCPQTEGGSGGPVDVSNEQSQGQLQGQSQESSNVNHNTNQSSANAGAISGSNSDSSATGIGIGGSADNSVAVTTGGASSGSKSYASGGQGGDGGDAYASGGDARAYGGDADSRSYSEGSDADASVGDVTSHSGDSQAYSGGNSQSTGVSISDNSVYDVEYNEASARAANVYSQVCQNGGSAQGIEGGFGVTNADVLCDHLKTAAVMREAYMFEMQYGTVQCIEPMEGEAVQQMAAEYSDTCMNEKAKHYYEAYHESMDDAIMLMDKVEEAGMLDKFMGYLVRPAALIGALVWLI